MPDFQALRCTAQGGWGGSAHYPDPTAQSALIAATPRAPRRQAGPGAAHAGWSAWLAAGVARVGRSRETSGLRRALRAKANGRKAALAGGGWLAGWLAGTRLAPCGGLATSHQSTQPAAPVALRATPKRRVAYGNRWVPEDLVPKMHLRIAIDARVRRYARTHRIDANAARLPACPEGRWLRWLDPDRKRSSNQLSHQRSAIQTPRNGRNGNFGRFLGGTHELPKIAKIGENADFGPLRGEYEGSAENGPPGPPAGGQIRGSEKVQKKCEFCPDWENY